MSYQPFACAYSRAGAVALLLCLVLALPLRAAQPADTLRVSLEEAVARSLEVSPEVGAVAADLDFAQARSRLAQAHRFGTEITAQTGHAVAPGLIIPGSAERLDELHLEPGVRNDWEDLRPYNQLEVSALQALWTWGELGGNIRAARHGIGVEEARVREEETEVAFRTAEIYYGLLLTEELSRLADEAQGVIDQVRNQLEELLEEGDESVSAADLYELEITEQEVISQTEELEQQRATLRSALARQLFLPEDEVALPEGDRLEELSFEDQPLEHYLELALGERPEVAQAEAGLAARQAQVEVARSDYYPKLFLGISSNARFAEGRQRQRNPFVSDPYQGRSLEAGLGLQLNLNYFQTRAEVDQARAEERQVSHQLEGARQLVQFEVEEAYREQQSASATLEARREALRLSRQWLREEQIDFDLDIGDPRTLIDAVEANLQQQIQYNEALQRYNLSVLRLHRQAGVLVQELQAGTLVD